MSNNKNIRMIAEGNWLNLAEITYVDAYGKSRTWETVGRTKSCGAVMMIARLKPSGDLILVRQYRPPVGCSVIEFPAGLVEPGEDPALAAVRELRGETGYTGVVCCNSKKSYSSPGLSSEYIVQFMIEVDESLQGELKTDFDETECIETFRVHPEDLLRFLDEREMAGDVIDAKVRSFSYALQVR